MAYAVCIIMKQTNPLNKGNDMKALKRIEVMASIEVRNLTKDILIMTESKDIVDVYYDIKLALKVIRGELNEIKEDLEKEMIDNGFTI